MTKKQFVPVIALLVGLALVILAVFWWLLPNWSEITRVFSSLETFKAWINSLGFWGSLVFVLITIAQVIVAPIPGNVVGVAGGALFGVWFGFILSYIGTVIGSILAFFLGHLLGKRLAIRLIGRERYTKYAKLFSGRASWGLLVVFIVPIFPDDILCILAGISPMPFLRFLLLMTVGRVLPIFVTNLVGAGLLNLPDLTIPLWLWLVIALVVTGLAVVYFMNRARFSQWLQQKLGLVDKPTAKPSTK